MPAASLQHLDRPISQGSDNRRIRQEALANQQTQGLESLVKLLRHLRLSALHSQPNLALAPVIMAAASLAQNLEQVAASLEQTTLLRRPSKVVASSALQEERIPVSVQEPAPGPDLPPVFLVTTTSSSSNNSPSHSHLVGQLPPLEEVLGLVTLVSAITIILLIPAVVYSAILARPTPHLVKPSSQLNKTHSAASGLKTKIRPIPNHPSEALVLSSNRNKSLAVCLADRMQTTPGVVGFLEP